MEEETIYLEADEEITSVIDKLKASECSAIKLVAPRSATILQSVVNLRLIKEEAERLKKKIALITQDKIGRRLASQVGFSVYEDASRPYTAEMVHPIPQPEEVVEIDMRKEKPVLPKDIKVHYYREPVEKAPPFKMSQKPIEINEPVVHPSQIKDSFKSVSRKNPPFVWIVLIILILGIGLVATDLTLSLVKVSLQVPVESFEKSIDIEVGDKNPSDQLDSGKIKGEFFEIGEEKSQTFDSTGKKNAGEKATGAVSVFNEAGVDQRVEGGSVFKANSGQLFKAVESVTVPKASLNPGGDKIAGRASLKIEAEEAGKGSNMPESTTYRMMQNDKITASGKISGGSDKEIKVVSESDLKGASERLSSDLAAEALSKLKEKTKGFYIVDGGVENEITDTSFSKTAGSEAPDFEVKIKIKSKTLALHETSLRGATLALINKDLPQAKALVLGESDTISTKVSELDLSQGKMILGVTLKGHLADKIDEQGLVRSLKGKTLPEAQKILNEIPDVIGVKIQRTPSFGFQRMPLLSRNIKIKLEYHK